MTAPTRREYADADRLLRAQGLSLDMLALRCWIADGRAARRQRNRDLARLIWWGIATVLFVVSLLLMAGAA